MSTLKRKPKPVPVPPETKRAYLVRGIDLLWNAKRACDGRVICSKGDRGDACSEAMQSGYIFKY